MIRSTNGLCFCGCFGLVSFWVTVFSVVGAARGSEGAARVHHEYNAYARQGIDVSPDV